MDFFALVPFQWVMSQYFTSKYLGFKLLRISQIFRKCWSLYEAIKFLEYLCKFSRKSVTVSFQISPVVL